jgi:hypothetical protein
MRSPVRSRLVLTIGTVPEATQMVQKDRHRSKALLAVAGQRGSAARPGNNASGPSMPRRAWIANPAWSGDRWVETVAQQA